MPCEKREVMIPMTVFETNSEPYAPKEDCCCPSAPPYSCHESSTPAETIYVVSQPPIIVAGIFTSKPAGTICPSCRQPITTEIVYRMGRLAFLLTAAMCCMGCNMGCCLIPLFMKRFKDVDHYCPCCRFHIYRYNRL
ncbi:cell death-inducing p53-target protein 1-like [Malaclemys terrapin pileata]|uniref:cell death-inducing p53-target protein 1-like n=1 Tax=Chrysemys picta bellii TaxID=8478 RepID=UPI000CE63299|nr:cell death-inducing p53-target protein 1-like [Chrysemys picta bellii]XP_053898798.1 cell death-inducing p53-target protein 1-like [Malaclemys terrapin pileata]